MKLRKLRYLLCAITLMGVYYFLGIGDHLHAKSYEHEFDYPLNTDIKLLIQELQAGKEPSFKPINFYNFRFITSCAKKCAVIRPNLVISVKSSMDHFDRRLAIRKTWGSESTFPEMTIKLLFFLGINESPNTDLQDRIDSESLMYNDIVQSNFVDNYFNNTIKTMMAFKWAYEFCPNSEYYLFSDDDMYISIYNVFKYLQDPYSYPNNIQPVTKIDTTQDVAKRESDGLLYAGYVFKSGPHRHIVSKWHVSLEEYPWDMWPPYVTAGAYIVSRDAMKLIYMGSLFTKHFRFDDIYLGIVSRKLDLRPVHCDEFYFFKKPYSIDNYKDVIASHGYGDVDELILVWNEQRELGNA